MRLFLPWLLSPGDIVGRAVVVLISLRVEEKEASERRVAASVA
jgi:hypothetical protein